MTVYRKNIHYAQEFQKQVHDKAVKSRNCASDKKVWLNNKYIKTKQNHKLETKFFNRFWALYPVENQAYKHELPKMWRIHNIFHMSLLEYNITKKE